MNIEIWKFLAGIGFFLFGMTQLETVLKRISGRSLKLFLKRNTQNLFKSISGGAIVTGILQSSSVVSLIMLAFVESGIITVKNALGIILGTNLGTTLSSWLFATVGFKLNVMDYALPIVAIAAIAMFFLEKRLNLYNMFLILFSLGILFLGLGFMKEGALAFVEDFDLKSYNRFGPWVFVIIGFILTTIIQSSSATLAITLTAIYSGVLTFPSAAGVVIGSEIGTTIKILLWGMKGSSDKKRVAWGNFIYNIFTAIVAYIALHGLVHFIENSLKITDPLIGIVVFQSSINLISILLFVPLLNAFAKWLEGRFNNASGNSYMSQNLPVLSTLATDAMKDEASHLLRQTFLYNKSILCSKKPENDGLIGNLKSLAQTYIDPNIEYNRLKQTEGDILGYYTKIHEKTLGKEDSALLLQYVNAVRHAIYSAKAVKDIAHNLAEFDDSSKDIKYRQRELIRQEWLEFDNEINALFNATEKDLIPTGLEKLLNNARQQEELQKAEVMKHLKNNYLNELEVSTLLNVHRELRASKKALLEAVGELTADN